MSYMSDPRRLLRRTRMHHSHGGFLRCLQPAPFISPAAEAEDDREKILSFFSQATVVPNRPILIWGALDDAFFLQAGQKGRQQVRRHSCLRLEFIEPLGAEKKLADQKHGPTIADHGQRSSDRTQGVSNVIPSRESRRVENCWQNPAAAFPHRTWSPTIILHMAVDEAQGAGPSDLSCFWGKAIAFVALEAVISVIGVDVDRRLLRLDRLDVAHRDVRVQLTEMQHGRDFRRLIGHPDDLAAVIADCHREARQIGRRAIGQRSAEAEAGDRDLADLSDRLACGSDVQHPGLHWWIGDKAPCGLHFFRRIAGFEPRFNAIEQGRRNRDVAERSKTVSDRADVTINAEDFLNDDDSALGRPRWIDTIGIELVAVAGSQFEVRSHGWNPFVLRKIQRAASGCRGGVLPPGVASSAVLLNMAKVM